jgi:GAF domain-containing protein
MTDAGQIPGEPFGAAGVDDLQELLLESKDIHDFLNALTVYFAGTLSGSDGKVSCTLTLLRDHAPVTVASSAPPATELDELQYMSGDGPCLTAARCSVTALVPDVLNDLERPGHEWGDYLRAVAGRGIRSILAVPFQLEGEAQGALNLYSTAPDAFTPVQVATAELSAAQASPVLRLAVRSARQTDMANDLMEALKSRTIIDIALGIIMAQDGCTQQVAFKTLQRASNTRQVKLRVLAARVVGGVSGGDISTHFTIHHARPNPWQTGVN